MRSLHMKKPSLLTCMVASIIICSTPNVLASQTFDFDFSSASVTGSGSLIGDANGDGTFTITSGSGSERLDGLDTTFSLVFNPNGRNRSASPLNKFNFDNQLLLNQAMVVDNDGLLFATAAGIEQNFFDDNGQLRIALSSSPVGFADEPLALQVTARTSVGTVPEPKGLLLAGLACLGFIGWRRGQPGTSFSRATADQFPT